VSSFEAVTLRPELGPEDVAPVRGGGRVGRCSFGFTPISHVIGREGLMEREAAFLERGYV
jgi:hypothetical protein